MTAYKAGFVKMNLLHLLSSLLSDSLHPRNTGKPIEMRVWRVSNVLLILPDSWAENVQSIGLVPKD